MIADHDTVFSAPKYCDTTENKGAYINIGPELKLEYHKFDAVPHPDIKPMVGRLPIPPRLSHRPLILLAGICAEFTHVDDVNQESLTTSVARLLEMAVFLGLVLNMHCVD